MATVWHENGSIGGLVDVELRQAALSMLVARRAMRDTLPSNLIHDVALELLLQLYLAHPRVVATEELLADATLPADSARRWLQAVISEGLAHCTTEAVALSGPGLMRMSDMLTKVVRSQRGLLGWANN